MLAPPLPPELCTVPVKELAALSVTVSVEVALPPLPAAKTPQQTSITLVHHYHRRRSGID